MLEQPNINAGPLLKAENISMAFGGLMALSEVNFQIRRNSITALIGPNGAGKTTFFNCLTSIYRPTKGRVVFFPTEDKAGTVTSFLKPNQVTRLGLARTFQNIRLFSNLTVLENVLIGRHTRLKSGFLGAILRTGQNRLEEKQAVDYCYDLLNRYGLEGQANNLARNLPYGDQRRLEIVRALATEPKLILLDEPAAGLNIGETRNLELLIRRLREEEKVTVLLIEHDMSLVMSVSETIYVMEYGRVIASGEPEEIKNNPAVIKAYLGEE